MHGFDPEFGPIEHHVRQVHLVLTQREVGEQPPIDCNYCRGVRVASLC